MKHPPPAPAAKSRFVDLPTQELMRLDPSRAVSNQGSARFDTPTANEAPAKSMTSRARRAIRMSGYRPAHPTLYRAWNFTWSFAMIIATLPLMGLIVAALALTQGPRNILYRGPRVGLNKETFYILKFKTLRDEAADFTRDKPLPRGSNLETPLGKPLRDTRLDELPQLFNVLRGDMNMFGPRPVRHSIAENCRQTIPGYDARFSVKPGLVGYTQALMPHSTDKAIRSRVNAILCRRPVSLVQETAFIVVTGLSVLRWTGRVALRSLVSLLPGSLRTSQRLLGIANIDLEGAPSEDLRLSKIDGEELVLEASRPLTIDPQNRVLPIRLRRARTGRPGDKTTRCLVEPVSVETAIESSTQSTSYKYTMRYKTTSPFQHYMIERYFIGSAVVE